MHWPWSTLTSRWSYRALSPLFFAFFALSLPWSGVVYPDSRVSVTPEGLPTSSTYEHGFDKRQGLDDDESVPMTDVSWAWKDPNLNTYFFANTPAAYYGKSAKGRVDLGEVVGAGGQGKVFSVNLEDDAKKVLRDYPLVAKISQGKGAIAAADLHEMVIELEENYNDEYYVPRMELTLWIPERDALGEPGKALIVMERLDEDLFEILKGVFFNGKDPLTLSPAIPNLLRGLKHFKAAQVVHGDVKPTNYMSKDSCGSGWALIDLDLAFYAPDFYGKPADQLPRSGTRAYMSPEHRDNAKTYDFWKDTVWSVAMTHYDTINFWYTVNPDNRMSISNAVVNAVNQGQSTIEISNILLSVVPPGKVVNAAEINLIALALVPEATRPTLFEYYHALCDYRQIVCDDLRDQRWHS